LTKDKEPAPLTGTEFDRLLRALIESPAVQELWSVADRGMPVFAHSMDVALLCLDAYPDNQDRFPEFRLDVVLIGAILHDLSKSSARRGGALSHSHIMSHEPGIAVAEAVNVLDQAQVQTGVLLDSAGVDHVWHVIAAHHGRWGKVWPRTPEAFLLHTCDNYSATHHRIAPIDANDILPLTEAGYRWPQIAERLGVNRSVVKSRLQDSCRAEGLRSPSDLHAVWREKGHVAIGDLSLARQLERARFVVDFARRCPDALLRSVHPFLPREAGHQRRSPAEVVP
jgi:hypothetical protein